MKFLWLCIDGLDITHAKRYMKQGKMPELKALTKRSAWGQMTPEIPFSPQSWTTIFTGLNAEHHGIEMLDKQNITVNTNAPPVWRLSSKAGITTGVFRVPFTFPPDEDTNGYMFSGWTAPYPAVYPNTEEYWPYLCPNLNTDAEEDIYHTGAAANEHVRIHELEVQHAKQLFTNHPVDFGIIFWSILDKLSHNIWEWRWNEDNAAEEREKWYSRVDRQIGEMVQALSPQMFVITSDHGFNHKDDSKTVWLPPWLENRGIVAWHTDEAFWLLKHPNVKPKQLDISNLDILPTIFGVLDWKLKYSLDGVAHKLTKHQYGPPISVATPNNVKTGEVTEYSPEERAAIEAKLKAIGYL